MSVELKIFGGTLLVKDKSLKKDPDLKPLAIAVKAANKAVAEAIIAGKLAETYPANINDYHKPKVWEDRPGLPRAEIGVFCSDFFETVAVWDPNTGEPAPMPTEPEYVEAAKLPGNLRAALLALFGRTDNITRAEYGQAIDLTNDDMPSFTRELGEAITRTPRVLALSPERQTELLDSVRAKLKETAQWPDIKKFMDKWLDTPPEKRDLPVPDKLRTPSGATGGGRNQTDRGVGFVMTHDILALEVAMALVGRAMDFDIYNPPASIVNQAREIINTKEKPFPQWFEAWRNMPGGMDYSRAITIYSVKCAPEGLTIAPGALITYLNKTLTETDHEHPSADIVAAACGIKLQEKHSDEDATKQGTENTTGVLVTDNTEDGQLAENAAGAGEPAPEVKSGRTVFSLEELEAGPDDTRAMMSDREIEICYEANALLSGDTDVMSKEEAEGVVTCTGHLVSHVVPLLVSDIAATEFCLSPEFSDEEIHHVATSILDAWSDNEAKRQIVALDAITEWRTELPASAVIAKPVIKVKPRPEPGVTPDPDVSSTHSNHLSYHQQLTIAAVQGLCANPAIFGCFEDIASMATSLASGITPEVAK